MFNHKCETHMRKTKVFAAAALILAGIAGWANSNNRALEAKATIATKAVQLDPGRMMVNAKYLPSHQFEDFSLVFPPHRPAQ
jgi:hypothetical protein